MTEVCFCGFKRLLEVSSVVLWLKMTRMCVVEPELEGG